MRAPSSGAPRRHAGRRCLRQGRRRLRPADPRSSSRGWRIGVRDREDRRRPHPGPLRAADGIRPRRGDGTLPRRAHTDGRAGGRGAARDTRAPQGSRGGRLHRAGPAEVRLRRDGPGVVHRGHPGRHGARNVQGRPDRPRGGARKARGRADRVDRVRVALPPAERVPHDRGLRSVAGEPGPALQRAALRREALGPDRQVHGIARLSRQLDALPLADLQHQPRQRTEPGALDQAGGRFMEARLRQPGPLPRSCGETHGEAARSLPVCVGSVHRRQQDPPPGRHQVRLRRRTAGSGRGRGQRSGPGHRQSDPHRGGRLRRADAGRVAQPGGAIDGAPQEEGAGEGGAVGACRRRPPHP